MGKNAFKFPSKPFKTLVENVTGVAKVAAGVTALGITGGTVGALAGSVMGALGGGSTLAKAFSAVSSLSGTGQTALFNGGTVGDALATMLIGDEAGDAQKEFIKQALNGGMTPDQVASNKKFQELNYNRSTGASQTAADGIKAFQEAQTEMKAIATQSGQLSYDSTKIDNQGAANNGIGIQQQAGVKNMQSKTGNTQGQQDAQTALRSNQQSIQQGLSGVNSAISGIASSYGMRPIGTPGSNPTAGTSIGSAPQVGGFNQTLGVAQGDLVKTQQETLKRQLLEATAAGASPAQLAEMQRRGEMAIQEQASRLAVANEREGAQAMLAAQQAQIPFLQAATGNATAMSQTDLAMQQMDQQWTQMAQDAMNQMRQQGLAEEEIQKQIADAKANYDMQKIQLQSGIQQAIASGNLSAAQLSLSDVQTAMSNIGTNLNSQNATGAQAMNSATNMIGDMMKAQAEAYKNAGTMAGGNTTGSNGGTAIGDVLGSVLGGFNTTLNNGSAQTSITGSIPNVGWQTGQSGVANQGNSNPFAVKPVPVLTLPSSFATTTTQPVSSGVVPIQIPDYKTTYTLNKPIGF